MKAAAARLSSGNSRSMYLTLPVSIYLVLSCGNTSVWNCAQCGQVIEAYSTMVVGASAEPMTMSGRGPGAIKRTDAGIDLVLVGDPGARLIEAAAIGIDAGGERHGDDGPKHEDQGVALLGWFFRLRHWLSSTRIIAFSGRPTPGLGSSGPVVYGMSGQSGSACQRLVKSALTPAARRRKASARP